MGAMIKVKDLSKYYFGRKAIDGVNFQIEEGEIVGLLGLNGAGKSTILKILGCFLLPSAGEAEVDGHSIFDAPNLIRKVIGYLPDSPPLYNEMTVSSYLRFVARIKEVPRNKVESSVEVAIGKSSLEDVVHLRLSELSYGFRQRVSIAQALVHDPKVLIFDEPISGLDPVQIVEMRDLILSLRGRHTVLLSSHILSEITKTCDRILIIDQGNLVAEGSEESLQKGMAQSMHINCEVESADDALLGKINGLTGVTAVRSTDSLDGGKLLEIETSGDVRKQVASAIVGAGVGLLGMHRAEAGLERLFMKLIKSSEGEAANG